jgi:peptidoglycan-N-acetylglucosamine deacetylase
VHRPPATRRRAAAALAVAALLAGCGGGSGEADTTATPAAATAAPSTAERAKTAPAKTDAASPASANAATAKPAPATLPGPAAQAAAIKRLARIGKPIYCAAGKLRLVALTFDDGPGRYTPIMLRQLRKAGARATFFLVGKSIDRYPDIARTERPLAAIGEHSVTHANLPTLSRDAARAEIAGGKAKAVQAAGDPVELFRPPYGSRNPKIDREIRRQKMAQILWDVDSADSRITPPANFHEISARVRKHTRPGSIVLMHDNRGQTIRAMRSILPALAKRHLELATVPELLAADPPTKAQLAKGAKGCKAGRAARRP